MAPITTAKATNVYISMGMPKIIQHRTAVNISSKAEANVFRIEFRARKKREVTMPIAALLTMMESTDGRAIAVNPAMVKAVNNSPFRPRAMTLHRMDCTYMNTLAIMMCTSQPVSFNRYSLYTPAKHEQKTCRRMRRMW